MNKQIATPLTIAAIAIAIGWMFWAQRFVPWTPMRIVGAVMVAGGFIGWATARVQLGKSFSIQAKATELVTRGIYSKIRNPVYVFGTIFFAGVFLWLAQPVLLLLLLVLVPMQIMRAKKEARVLESKFGEAYRQYRAKTWF